MRKYLNQRDPNCGADGLGGIWSCDKNLSENQEPATQWERQFSEEIYDVENL